MRLRLLPACIATILIVACAEKDHPKVAAVSSEPAPTAPATQDAQLPDVGRLETVTVTSQGSGPTAGVAVQEAMKLAILQVNGATIDTTSIAVKFGLDVAEGQTSVMLRGSAFAEAVAQRSKGAITGFKLVNMTEPAAQGGLYKVTIEAAIAKFHAPEDAKKIRIVIAPVRANATFFGLGGQNVAAARVAQNVHRGVIDALAATGRYSVLDREFGGEVQQELDLIAGGQTPAIEMAKLSQSLSADIVWVGTITDFSYIRSARKLSTSDRELVSYSGGWSVSQRLLNVSTRQIMLSATLQGRAPSTEPTTLDRGIDPSHTEGDMESAIVREAVAAILRRTFPITVVAKDGNNVVLSQGGQSLQQGARYSMVLMGNEVTDPQTRQSLGRLETACCDVVIDRVTATMSYGHLENAKMPLDAAVPAELQVGEERKLEKRSVAENPNVNSPTLNPAPMPKGSSTSAVAPPTVDDGKKW